jgi:aminoglycoside phosphotransferase (APT) family kinase protein
MRDGDIPFAVRSLEKFIAKKTQAQSVTIARCEELTGGAVLRHWRIEAEICGARYAGSRVWVLRADGATPLGLGLTRAQEFALQRLLFAAGLPVAEPLLMCCAESVIGAPFFLMGFLPGISDGATVVASGRNDALAEELGLALAQLHGLDLRAQLRFLPPPPVDAAVARIDQLGALIAADDEPHPVANWALRWLAQHRPAPQRAVLCHGDFRTGNYRVESGKLAAVLDWDFAGWSDPDEDIAWFCAQAWRFGAAAGEAGGIAPRGVFYRAYESASGRKLDPRRIHYWEVMAALRWLVIALKQRDRFLRKGECSLDLALTGRRVAECEWELLRLTGLQGRGDA